jgi:hypothetical protein
VNAVALNLNITGFYYWTNDEKIINDSLLSTMNYLAASDEVSAACNLCKITQQAAGN